MRDGRSDAKKTFYVMPNTECDLRCAHCDISRNTIPYNENAFFDMLKQIDAERNKDVIVFGGEPTLYRDRFYKILAVLGEKPIVSTNLLNLDDRLIDAYRTGVRRINTSWNEFRFTDEQFTVWKYNLLRLHLAGLKCTVMITMTYGLMKDGVGTICGLLDELSYFPSVDRIQFEYLVSGNNYATLADNWLCELHWHWPKWRFLHVLEDRILKTGGLFNVCDDVSTLHPDGNLVFGCPHCRARTFIYRCLKCGNRKLCRPCVV